MLDCKGIVFTQFCNSCNYSHLLDFLFYNKVEFGVICIFTEIWQTRPMRTYVTSQRERVLWGMEV